MIENYLFYINLAMSKLIIRNLLKIVTFVIKINKHFKISFFISACSFKQLILVVVKRKLFFLL